MFGQAQTYSPKTLGLLQIPFSLEWSIRMFQNRERKMPLTQTLILIHINKFKVNIIILRSSLLQ